MEQRTATEGDVSEAIEMLARAGYAAKGIVYVTVGALSAAAAFLSGSSDAEGSRPALASLADEGWGIALLWIVAGGCAGYVVWRLVQAVLDPEHRGTDAKGLATRAVFVVSAFVYGSLGVWIVTSLLGGGGGGSGAGGSGARAWSARLMAQPFGAWLLGLAGAAVLAFAAAELVKAWRASFEKRLVADLDGKARRMVRRIARVGLVSRGLVFAVMGGLAIWAAVRSDPSRARGFEGALEWLARQGWGPALMGAVALGLVAYGVFQMVKARYRRIAPAVD